MHGSTPSSAHGSGRGPLFVLRPFATSDMRFFMCSYILMIMKTNVQRAVPISRVIGRGQTGCALRPSVPCDKNKTDPFPNTISKVFRTKKEQENELKRQTSIVKEIDPTNIFTMKFEIGCEISGSNLRKAELIECNFEEQDTFYQLIYKDGGVNIRDAAKTIPFEVIFDSLRTAFLGLELMREKGVIHSDLKPDNIVYNDKTNKLAIIDFGLCTKLDDRLFISNRNVDCNHVFMYWPSEFNAMATKPSTLRNSEGLNMFVTEKLIRLLDQNPTLHNIRNKMNEFNDLCDTKPPEMYSWRHVPETENHLYTRRQRTTYHELLDENTNRSWRTVDMYGLGASIIEVLAISYKANPNMITLANQDFYVAVVDLCMKMMATNPYARLEPLVAIAKHGLIVARLSPADQKRMARWIEIGPAVLIDQIMDNCRELKRLVEVRKMADLSPTVAEVMSKVTRASTNTLLREDRYGQDTVVTHEKPTIVTKGVKRTRTRAIAYSAIRRNLESQINDESCVMYATTTCKICTKAAIALKRTGAVFTVVELDKMDGAIETELIAITGVTSVPQVFVGGEFIGGFSDGGMGGVVPLLKSGKLTALLIAAGAIPPVRPKSISTTKATKLRSTGSRTTRRSSRT